MWATNSSSSNGISGWAARAARRYASRCRSRLGSAAPGLGPPRPPTKIEDRRSFTGTMVPRRISAGKAGARARRAWAGAAVARRAAVGHDVVMPTQASAEQCLDEETMAAFIAGGLASGELARVEAHVATCGDCRGVVADA